MSEMRRLPSVAEPTHVRRYRQQLAHDDGRETSRSTKLGGRDINMVVCNGQTELSVYEKDRRWTACLVIEICLLYLLD